MSSINNNPSAMVALDTLKGINRSLAQVQTEISTGKTINNAKDNAAIWSIATVMETDVAGFEQISNSLNLGSATVGVARKASEDIVGYVQKAKDLIISAQESNVPREKIQTDINELVAQINTTVNAAQFNGQNLLSSSGSINVLASLDRGADGTVTASQITVDRQNLTTDPSVTSPLTGAGAATVSSPFNGSGTAGGVTDAFTIATGVVEGNAYSLTIGGTTVNVTAAASDDEDSLAGKFVAALTTAALPNLTFAIKPGAGNENIVQVTNSDAGTVVASVAQTQVDVAGGKLAGIETLDVTTDAGAAQALTDIEGFLTAAIDAAADLGSKQKRIDNQADFVSTLSDSLKVGISTLTDADLEETSARLQALQVQQQLGVQALSIANQAPQSLLSLFQ